MKRTLIGMCIAYALGILLSFWLLLTPLIFALVAIVLAFAIKLVMSRGKIGYLPILILICFVAGTFSVRLADDISLKAPNQYVGRYVTLSGRIVEEPTLSIGADFYNIRLQRLTFDGSDVRMNNKIDISLLKKEGDCVSYGYGDIITVQGFLQLLPEPMNDKGFNTALKSKTQGVFFEIKSDYQNTELIGNRCNWWNPADAGYMMRKYSEYQIDRYLKGDAAGLTKAILLGTKYSLNDQVLLGLQVSGLSHIVSVSGLHISSLLMVLGWLGLAFGIRKKWVSVLGLFFLGFIVIYTGATVSVMRAVLMSGVYLSGKLLKRDVYSPTALAFAAMLLLLLNPFTLFDASFQLSVGSILGLVIFAQPFTDFLIKWVKMRWIAASIASTIAVMIIIIPIVAYYFNIVSLITIFANLVAVPFMPYMLFASAMLVLFGALWPIGMIFAGFLQIVVGLLANFTILLGKIPFAYINAASPGLLFMTTYGLLVYAGAGFLYKNSSLKRYVALTAALALIMASTASAFLFSRDMNVTFINVGQGDAALVSLPGNHKLIIDGGGSPPGSTANIGESVFVPYLKKHGVFTIDAAVVSHYDQDHSQGVIAALNDLNVKNLILPYRSRDYHDTAKTKLEELAASKGTHIYYFLASDNIRLGDAICLEAFAPTLEDANNLEYNENDRSMVIKLSYGQVDFLFTGDIEAPIEEKLLKNGHELNSEVLKVAHHGSQTSSTKAFIDLVSPKFALISVGEHNPYGHPGSSVLTTLKQSGAKIYRTDESGDVTFTVNQNSIKRIRTLK